MGIVQNQSIKNTIITFFGFGIGAINALFLYTNFLGKLHYGIVATVLSFANILMPIMAFGAQNTLVRFFSYYKTDKTRNDFLSFMLVFPLVLILPVGGLFFLFYDYIASFWIVENPSLKPFFWLIPIIGIFMAYFEIFYAWVKVHFQSVVGNFISEIFGRALVFILLFFVHLNILTKSQFVYFIVLAYGFQLIAIIIYAFSIKKPVFTFSLPENLKDIVQYSLFIIVSGGVAVMLVDFDKVMIPRYLHISNNSLYAVAIFISTVIIVPSRAMNQIVAPITAKLLADNNYVELDELYKKCAINLQIIAGLFMLLIFVNIKEIYQIIPKDYGGGIWVVFMIGLCKFYDALLGNNNAIILNTKHYRTVLLFGVFTVFLMIVLNMIFIPRFGIEGSAFATLITVFVYNSIKLFYVVYKTKLFPFTNKTIVSLLVISTCFFAFFYWDFSFNPLVNIILKSVLLTTAYVFVNYKFTISDDFNTALDNILLYLKKK